MIRTDLPMNSRHPRPASPPKGGEAPPTHAAVRRPRAGADPLASPALAPYRLADAKKTPLSIRVPGVSRDLRVKIASERAEWRDAFQLVSSNYQARGYEEPLASKVRFTPFHALPDVVTLVAKLDDRVLATFSLVPDNTLLGLPLESIYGDEIKALRRSRRRVAEVTSFAADKDLGLREFRQVFVALIRLGMHYHLSQGVGHLGDHGESPPPRLLHQGDGVRPARAAKDLLLGPEPPGRRVLVRLRAAPGVGPRRCTRTSSASPCPARRWSPPRCSRT